MKDMDMIRIFYGWLLLNAMYLKTKELPAVLFQRLNVSQYTDTFTCHLITSKDVNLNDYNDRGKYNRMEREEACCKMKLSDERLL